MNKIILILCLIFLVSCSTTEVHKGIVIGEYDSSDDNKGYSRWVTVWLRIDKDIPTVEKIRGRYFVAVGDTLTIRWNRYSRMYE
jgi:hypothetical protein